MDEAWQSDGITLHCGDSLAVLKSLPAESVQCCVTSPPFFHLRDYGMAGQIGLEPTLAEYITALVDVFREVRRVLRKDGTAWVEMGDCYTGGRGGGWKGDEHGQQHKEPIRELGPKQLLGVPWRLAFALQDDGWVLRRDIVWHKTNAMPESVQDRPSCSHTFIFLLARSARYHYDGEAIKEDAAVGYNGSTFTGGKTEACRPGTGQGERTELPTRNCRDVWSIPTEPLPIAHFAAFPTELARRAILAGTSERGACPVCGKPWVRVASRLTEAKEETTDRTKAASLNRTHRQFSGGFAPVLTLEAGWAPACTHDAAPVPCVVLDCFSGAGTTLLVANRLGRHGVGIELNPEYWRMAQSRLVGDAPLLHMHTGVASGQG